MGKIVKTKCEAVEFTTFMSGTVRTITVVNGKIERIIVEYFGGRNIYFVKEDSTLEFDDISYKKSYFIKENSKILYRNNLKYEERKISSDEFQNKVFEEIEILSRYNLKEFKKLYETLDDVLLKHYCKLLQRKMLELLNF